MKSMSGYGIVAARAGVRTRLARNARRSHQRPGGSLAASTFIWVWPDGRESLLSNRKDEPR